MQNRNLTARVNAVIRALIFLSLVFTAAASQAESVVLASVEWLTCSSDIVALGTIEEAKENEHLWDCVLDVKELIKGKADGKIHFSFQFFDTRHQIADDLGKEVVVFLSTLRDQNDNAKGWVTRNRPMPLLGRLVPSQYASPFVRADLTNLRWPMISFDMSLVKSREALLDICRKWSDSPDRTCTSESFQGEAEREIFTGSGNDLIIPTPATNKFLDRFINEAESEIIDRRIYAAKGLAIFPDERAELTLRRMLKDGVMKYTWVAPDIIGDVHYPVREAAFESLKLMQKPAGDVVLVRKATAEEQKHVRLNEWAHRFKRTLKDGWKVSEVRDGETRHFDSGDRTEVVVELSHGADTCTLFLVPKEFEKPKSEKLMYIGSEPLEWDGGRSFYAPGLIPQSILNILYWDFYLDNFENASDLSKFHVDPLKFYQDKGRENAGKILKY